MPCAVYLLERKTRKIGDYGNPRGAVRLPASGHVCSGNGIEGIGKENIKLVGRPLPRLRLHLRGIREPFDRCLGSANDTCKAGARVLPRVNFTGCQAVAPAAFKCQNASFLGVGCFQLSRLQGLDRRRAGTHFPQERDHPSPAIPLGIVNRRPSKANRRRIHVGTIVEQ